MKCFHFSNEKNQNETKSMPVQSSAYMSTDHDVRRIESGFDSQNVSDISIESSSRTPVRSPSQKPNNLRVFCLSELKAATRNFSNLLMIGEGGFGCVYRGRITSTDDPRTKIDVAIKQLGTRGLQGHKEWVTEVNVLGVVEHPNLVKLVGYCAQDDERGLQRSLIYEYMRNRSVEDHLSLSSTRPLSWSMRLKIAMDSACGLAYLHEQMDFQIIFRDFKSSNILLDDQWNAKLSDFGLAREGPSEGYSHVSTAIVGTLGYAAPEYIQTGRLTSKSDVWSYGVFLYELITGRRPIDRNRPRSEQNLLEWVKPHLTDMKKFELILDPRLEGKYDLNTAMKLAAVANRCLLRQQRARPKMSEVLEKVKFILEGKESENPLPPVNILDPKNPFDDPVRKESNSKRSLLVSKIADCLSILRAWSPKLIRIS